MAIVVIGQGRQADAQEQRQLSYDPFHLMPKALPARPRGLLTVADVARVWAWMDSVEWIKLSMKRLLDAANADMEMPTSLCSDNALSRQSNGAIVGHVYRNALAHVLTGQESFRARAIHEMRFIAREYLRIPIVGLDNKIAGGSLGESHLLVHLARACDLLAAGALDNSDRQLMEEMLREGYKVLDRNPQRDCSNHNTWNQAARISVAAALGDMQGIHDALYGSPAPSVPQIPDTPLWRYGLIHQLRHDLLSDGMHWERTLGYHGYTLMAFVEAATTLANLGVDIWHVELPPAHESEGADLHRGYGPDALPRGKCFKAAFDVPLYHAYANGDLPLLHDSGLAALRGLTIWGILYDAAFDAYGDEHYAWLLNYFEREHPQRPHPGIPMGLQTVQGDVDFVRLRSAEYPAGRFNLAQGKRLSLVGRHVKGCTLMPAAGQALLRSDATDPKSAGAFVFWGPHSAGHQSPAALHVELHAMGRHITAEPVSGGYDDAVHLSWKRATVAHNTISVDRQAMFPYDLPTQSIWEADSWRGRESDGRLDLFQIEEDWRALRMSNSHVYPGVKLDRTLIQSRDWLLDVYRVIADQPHLYDWTMHLHGQPNWSGETQPYDLGQGPGYAHLANARSLKGWEGQVKIHWPHAQGDVSVDIVADGQSRIVLADAPSGKTHNLGEREEQEGQRSCVLVRKEATSTLFVALWSLPAGQGQVIESCQVQPNGLIEVALGDRRGRRRWCLPFRLARVEWV